jgi:predicted methyltransferase
MTRLADEQLQAIVADNGTVFSPHERDLAREVQEQRALIAAIDAYHHTIEIIPGRGYWVDCLGCGAEWPCYTHRLIHPKRNVND